MINDETVETPDARQIDGFKAPMEVCWQFDYAISQEKLDNLYRKAKQAQWDAEQQLDWSIEIDPSKPIIDEERNFFLRMPFFQRLSKTQRETFAAHATAQLLSQFLHGEQGALMTASALTHAVPDYDAKLYCATQTMDEARHVEVYHRYINKLALVYPMSPWLKELIDATLAANHYAKIMVGMNMVVEGLALAAFHNMRRDTSCELLRSLTENVLRDESRHVAFGNVYLKQTLADMHADDREDVAEFAFAAVKGMVDAQGGVDGSGQRKADPGFLKVLERSGIDLQDFIAALHEAGAAGIRMKIPPGHLHSFRDLMMPALVRVGAVTERSRELYQREGIPIWDDTSVLESMEDANTGDIVFPD
ncbi:MAG: ferritin-like domain-containing protein [Deltaproteobacteria bacterium]|nr:ferritin-like domain-containing protein [Deltaproteobacteria bacterium]MBI3388123.1 ferritin-like domain-containing protein [Deltaproteobacteria bacterium]